MPPEPGDHVATERAVGAEAGTPAQERPLNVHDMDALLARVGGDAALLGKMAALFLDECPAYVSSIRQAVAGRDARTLEGAAHALRGSASNFAADRTAQAARRLELMGHEGDLTGSEQALRSLEDVLERLKSSSKTSQIPVIVLSGSTDPNAEAAVRQLGADVYLSKPVDVNELLGTLARVLGQTLEGQPQGGGAKTPPV